MYTEQQRDELLVKIVNYLETQPVFEGLLQIGSGVNGYPDIYSDIDLMAGCTCEAEIGCAESILLSFFEELRPVYVDKRKWSPMVRGLSVYLENGLSVDISFMPTKELWLRSEKWRILFGRTVYFENTVRESAALLRTNAEQLGIDDSIHHRFIFALRRCEIAVQRGELIYAEIALSEARQILLRIEAARERKKLHQFKAYNTLDSNFLVLLEKTYPEQLESSALTKAQNSLLNLYVDVIEKCSFLTFDDRQLSLLGWFGNGEA